MRLVVEDLLTGATWEAGFPYQDVHWSTSLSRPASLRFFVGEFVSPLEPWRHGVWVEENGALTTGGIVTRIENQRQGVEVECTGFSAYPKGQPWVEDVWSRIQVDPMDVVRHIWSTLQSYPDGNLHVSVSSLKSTVRVGEKAWTETVKRNQSRTYATKAAAQKLNKGTPVKTSDGKWRVSWVETDKRDHEAKPFTLEPYTDDDLARVIHRMEEEAGVEFLERVEWQNGRVARFLDYDHHFHVRRHDLRVEVGVNAHVRPSWVMDGQDYASAVTVWGAGEGSKMVRTGPVTADTGKLRRCVRYTDKKVTSHDVAGRLARRVLSAQDGNARYKQVKLLDSPLAPVASIRPGNELRVLGEFDQWVRVLGVDRSAGTGEVSLEVELA